MWSVGEIRLVKVGGFGLLVKLGVVCWVKSCGLLDGGKLVGIACKLVGIAYKLVGILASWWV